MTLNCAIIDDEPLALEMMSDYVQKTPFLTLTVINALSLKAAGSRAGALMERLLSAAARINGGVTAGYAGDILLKFLEFIAVDRIVIPFPLFAGGGQPTVA